MLGELGEGGGCIGFKGREKRDDVSWGPQRFRVLSPVDHPNQCGFREGVRQEAGPLGESESVNGVFLGTRSHPGLFHTLLPCFLPPYPATMTTMMLSFSPGPELTELAVASTITEIRN